MFSNRGSRKLPAISKMEEGKAEQEVDELEILLNLIPNATSGSWHPQNSIQKYSSTDFERNHLHEETRESFPPPPALSFGKQGNSFEGTCDGKIETYGRLDGDRLGLEGDHQTPIKIMDQEESNLPSEQSLSSSLAELSFKGEEAIKAANSQRLDHTFLLDDQFANLLKDSLPLSPQSHSILTRTNTEDIPPNRFDQFNVEMNGKRNVDFLKLDDQVQGEKSVSCQLLAYQTNPSQVLLTVSSPGTEVPDVPCSQSYFSSLQSPVLGMQSQEFTESHIPWLHAEEERYSIMHKKYLHWHDLQNQRSEARNLIQASENAANVIRTWNIEKSYVNNPISYQYENFSEESFQSDGAIPRRFGCSGSNLISSILCRYYAQGFCGRGENCPFTHGQRKKCPISFANPQPALSPKDFNVVQGFGKMGEQSYPEKILMRKNGLNSVKEINFIRESELFTNSSSNGRMISNGHFYHNAHIVGTRSSPVDGRKYWPQPLDTKDSRHDNLRLQTRKYNSVDEVTGRIYLMAKDQSGCRFLQRKMTEGNAEDIEKIFLEIVGHVVELMTHPFGNYLVQKLLEVCSEDQRTQIVFAITAKAGDLLTVSINMHGTRSVQKVIETIKSPEQFLMVVASLKPGIVNLIKDLNGYHVAECCLQHLMPGYIEFLFEAVSAHCVELATDCHGCRVLQKCLGHSDGEHRLRLLSAIIANALILSQDPFGNYVVQYVFELEGSWARTEVLNQLEGYYRYLSMQKYSSNVVEKCLKYAGEERFARIIQEFMDHPQLDQMMLDPYANYVIQTALNHSKGALHAALLEAIRPHIPALRTNPYGKKVLSSCGLKK